MLSATERRRLMQAMNAEPVRARMALARCAAGLAVIVLIAVIGASEGNDPEAAGNVAAADTPLAGSTAQEHRRQVFDERRKRFKGEASRQTVAGGTEVSATGLPPARP